MGRRLSVKSAAARHPRARALRARGHPTSNDPRHHVAHPPTVDAVRGAVDLDADLRDGGTRRTSWWRSNTGRRAAFAAGRRDDAQRDERACQPVRVAARWGRGVRRAVPDLAQRVVVGAANVPTAAVPVEHGGNDERQRRHRSAVNTHGGGSGGGEVRNHSDDGPRYRYQKTHGFGRAARVHRATRATSPPHANRVMGLHASRSRDPRRCTAACGSVARALRPRVGTRSGAVARPTSRPPVATAPPPLPSPHL